MVQLSTLLAPATGKVKAPHAPALSLKGAGAVEAADFSALIGDAGAVPEETKGTATSPLALAMIVPQMLLPTKAADPAQPAKRQAPAGDGKSLPDDTADADEDDAPLDPTLVWLPPVAMPVVEVPVKIQAPVTALPGVTTAAPANATAVAAPTPPAVQANAAPADPAPPPPVAPADQARTLPGVTVLQAQAPDAKLDKPVPATASAEPRLRAASLSAPAQPIAAARADTAEKTIQPAIFAFSAAREASSSPRTKERADASTIAPTAATPQAETLRAVAATSDSQTPTLDTRRGDWVQGMVDHIEKLRDNADAGDTRIRLAPDALGNVDVSIRKQGDTVHVHFAADVAETRTLIADAQPRLAEIAESRGLRLGQSSVDGGAGGQFGTESQRQQQAAATPQRPAAFTPVTSDDDADSDTRIA